MIDHLRALAASLAGYLGARLQLAGLESKEAALHYLKILAWLGVAIFGLVFGYVFFVIACVFLISFYCGLSWMWVLFAAGIVHFVVTGIGVLVARAKFTQPMFAATIAEFKKDQTWLTQPGPNARQN